jgi:MFS family permease
MSESLVVSQADDRARPTAVRHQVLLVTTLTSFLLYLDRVCMSEVIKDSSFKELGLGDYQMSWVLSAFFFSYALFQVPAGWLSDRFGARGMMSLYVLLWSVFTALTGLATGFTTLLVARLGCGIAQAGAYPTSGGLLSRWTPFHFRGMASSIVAAGGRIGMTLSPLLTAMIMVHFGGWRTPLVLYGAAGIIVAWAFWLIFYNRPESHPRCNQSECDLIEHSRPASAPSPHGKAGRVPLLRLVSSRSMWMMCISQVGTNLGWAFLITLLPMYLLKVKHVENSEEGGLMATIALSGGMAGLIVGGWFTDMATRRFGRRWGRCGPLAASRFACAATYILCLWLESPWSLAVAFCFIGFACDLGIGGTWAFAQDVGGRHVGSILGWGNMFGNLGAWATPPILMWAAKTWDPQNHNWHAVFLVCAAGMIGSGFASLGIDATIPVAPPEEDEAWETSEV